VAWVMYHPASEKVKGSGEPEFRQARDRKRVQTVRGVRSRDGIFMNLKWLDPPAGSPALNGAP